MDKGPPSSVSQKHYYTTNRLSTSRLGTGPSDLRRRAARCPASRYLSLEHTRALLGGRREGVGNLMAAGLGIATPF